MHFKPLLELDDLFNPFMVIHFNFRANGLMSAQQNASIVNILLISIQ